MADGKVAVAAGNFGGQTFEVGDDWKLYQFEFTGGELKKPAEAISLQVAGAGTLWLDNMAVYQKSLPLDALYPAEKQKMAAIAPGNVRIWALQNNVGFDVSLDAGLSSGWSAPSKLDQRRIQPNSAVGLHQMLTVCEELGAQPWIIVSTRYTPDEQANLIEYLAGPVTSPYGKKRADWGHPAPWTQSFSRISLEMGNEVWNNSFKAQGFAGEPQRYGAFAQMMFEAMQKSPYFDKNKFELIVNGWQRSRARRVTAPWPHKQPRPPMPSIWRRIWAAAGMSAASLAAIPRPNLRSRTRRSYTETFALAHAAARELSQGRAQPLKVRLYESGPGYSLPGPDKPVDEKEQARGKSLGLALAYFDQVLQAQELDFGPLAFFITAKAITGRATPKTGARTRRGWDWNCSTNARPEICSKSKRNKPCWPIWRRRRNRALTTKATSKPVRSRASKARPPCSCTLSRDGDKFALVMLSLRPDGQTPVSVKLPFAPQGEVTVETLSGASLSSNNIKSDEVTVASATRKIERDFDFELPPHSMVVVSGSIAP